jgi:hypothetical protein
MAVSRQGFDGHADADGDGVESCWSATAKTNATMLTAPDIY